MLRLRSVRVSVAQLAEMMIIIIAKAKHVPLATLNISPYVSMMTANGKVSTLIR